MESFIVYDGQEAIGDMYPTLASALAIIPSILRWDKKIIPPVLSIYRETPTSSTRVLTIVTH